MATPRIKSYDQYLGDALRDFFAASGLNDASRSSAILQFFEANARLVSRANGDILQVLRDQSVDRASGDTLRRIAQDDNVSLRPAVPSTDVVTVTDSSFDKIATKIYSGAAAPNVGTTALKVSDASLFPASGQIYIGRGTNNIEGPLSYASITPVGGYFEINLSSPTTKFHNVSETVILAQGGNRSITQGTLVRAPASGGSPDVSFSVDEDTIILDGEDTLTNVRVTCQAVGTIGNVPRGAIREFTSEPFPGASVINEKPFSNGRDEETDEELRARIKLARLSRGLGVESAIRSAVLGAQAPDETSVASSVEVVSTVDKTTVYADDNTGYERKTEGVGLEFIVDQALGGEQTFQLASNGRTTSISKAFIQSEFSEPFSVFGSDRLALLVGGKLSEHTFASTDFTSEGAASAYEIVASINSNSLLSFSATTADGGTKVVLSAKSEENEFLQITSPSAGTDAAPVFGFPSNEVETLRLYKNGLPLSKDGRSASVVSSSQVNWSPTIVDGDTLILKVDNTSFVTYTFNNADFIAQGTYSTVSSGNDLQSWVDVMNAKLIGVTAAIIGQAISLTSNLGANSRAAVEISPSSTLVTKAMFSSVIGLSASGKTSDYQFSRNTGQIKLTVPLQEGDSLTAGSSETEAMVVSDQIIGGTLTIPATAYMWLLVDDPSAYLISTGVAGSTLLDVTKPSSNIVRYTSNVASAFSNVQVGDYVIVWTKELLSSNRLEGRVNAVTATTLDIRVTPIEYAASTVENNVAFERGFTVIRTDRTPQRVEILAGTYNIYTLANQLNQQLTGAKFLAQEDELLIVKSLNSESAEGSLLIVDFDENADPMVFDQGQRDTSIVSSTAVRQSNDVLGDMPAFFHGKAQSNSAAAPPVSYISSVTSPSVMSSFDPNLIVAFKHPLETIKDGQPAGQEKVQMDNISGANIAIENSPYVKRIRSGVDRFYLANPVDLGAQDDLVVVLDSNPTDKTFNIPLYRNATTNITSPLSSSSFNAYDADAGPTAGFSTGFGSGFKFDNYKVEMRAKRVLNPAGTQNALLFRSKQWGIGGERLKVGYFYPTSPSQGIMSNVVSDGEVQIQIYLKSGLPVATAIDGTTEWNITISPNTPVAGVDQVTYTWSGVGTNPNLTALLGGEYVNISRDADFNKKNKGVFRVSTEPGFLPTSTSFSVQRPNGAAVPETSRSTLVTGAISFYLASATTAAEVNTYVNSSVLTDIIESSIVNEGGTSGSGTITLSTFEESNFTEEYKNLRDGLNWVASTNLSGSPQFNLKRPLIYTSDVGYAFNEGEPIRLIPTTPKQISQFLNVLAVSGISTLGEVSVVDRENSVQLSTQVLGSDGAVQIAGGSGSMLNTTITESSSAVDNYTKSRALVNRGSSSKIEGNQWFRLEASNFQNKLIGVNETSTVRIIPNQPVAGKSIIELGNRAISDRFFGAPRHTPRVQGSGWRVEKHGRLAALIWDEINGSSPVFSRSANLNDAAGGRVNITKLNGQDLVDYYVADGLVSFSELSPGDKLTVSGMSDAENNGTFEIVGVSDDGRTVRVINPNGISNTLSSTITITSFAGLSGDTFTILGSAKTEGIDWSLGVDDTSTAINLATALNTISGVQATPSGATILVEIVSEGSPVTLTYTGLPPSGATISNTTLWGPTFSSGNFSSTVGVREGDTMILSAPFSSLNQGTHRVVRVFNDTIYFENNDAVEENVVTSSNPISVGYSGTTGFNVSAASRNLRLSWNGAGTQPDLSVLRTGDTVTLGTDFNSNNQGTFTIVEASNSRAEITDVTLPAGSSIATGNYMLINSAGNATQFYIWFNVDSGGGDPMLVGYTGIEVPILSSDSAAVVASKFNVEVDAEADFSSQVLSGSTVRIQTTGQAETASATNFNVSGLSISIFQEGLRTYLVAVNPEAVSETGILITDVLSFNRPQIKFWEYEASVPADKIVISGLLLDENNQGSRQIEYVMGRNRAVVSQTLDPVDTVVLGSSFPDIRVEEGVKFTAYKKVYSYIPIPGSLEDAYLTFDTKEGVEKMTQAGDITISSLGKLNFSNTIVRGLDSYRYDIGLLAEINRIIYGDPRDNFTYPGVGAAGAEIFIDPPLVRRVDVSIVVRVQTGIPFAQVVEQVRNAVAALINGQPIGQSISISSIVATVDEIPGVRAVSISSPLYDVNNDVIVVNSNEKALVINPVTGITVAQQGT